MPHSSLLVEDTTLSWEGRERPCARNVERYFTSNGHGERLKSQAKKSQTLNLPH